MLVMDVNTESVVTLNVKVIMKVTMKINLKVNIKLSPDRHVNEQSY